MRRRAGDARWSCDMAWPSGSCGRVVGWIDGGASEIGHLREYLLKASIEWVVNREQMTTLGTFKAVGLVSSEPDGWADADTHSQAR
jgi:hypothetical protein